MSIKYISSIILIDDVKKIENLQENWVLDKKGKDIKPAKLSKTISAFANSNGGEIFLGISQNVETRSEYYWNGFDSEEETLTLIKELSNHHTNNNT